MAKKLDQSDRDILQFRPNIAFIEPDQEPGIIEGTDATQLEDVQAARARIKKLAQAVNLMATAIQARADQRADMIVKLDPTVDQDTIQAMRRKFPDADPTQITYTQYRQVKGDIRSKGIEIGKQPLVTPQEVQLARDNIDTFIPGRFGTDEAKTGGLRPELDQKAMIIPPINIEEIQINLICILVNFIWANFIKPVFKPIGIPGLGSIADLLPDKLCDPGADIEIPGLFMLGGEVPDLLKGTIASKATEEAGI